MTTRNHLLASTNEARSTLSAAIAYARLGFRPTPTVAGSPRVRAWQVERFLESEEDVRAVWRHTDDGVGLLMGQCSLGDLVAIVASGDAGRAVLRALDERYGRPPATLTGSTSAGDLQLVYRVVVPQPLVDKLTRAFGRSSDARPMSPSDSPTNLIRNCVGLSPLHDRTIHGLDVLVRGSQLPVACGRGYDRASGDGPRWTRPILPAELPAQWYEMLVEATNR